MCLLFVTETKWIILIAALVSGTAVIIIVTAVVCVCQRKSK